MAVTISLFSGCGGLDLGAEQAGAVLHSAIETDRDAAASFESNFSSLSGRVRRSDLRAVSTAELLAGLNQDPDLLLGAPPCTPFSKSGNWIDWKRTGLDPTASLVDEFVRVAREARPRSFIFENVPGLTFNNHQARPTFTRLLDSLRAIGYRVEYDILDSTRYGVAQARRRLIVVGLLSDTRSPGLPVPTHGPDRHLFNTEKPIVSSRVALENLDAPPEPSEELSGKWSTFIEDIPPGSNYLHYSSKGAGPDIFQPRSRYWNFLLKLDPEKPSPTIQAQPGPSVGPFHWENRRLRAQEVQRLFGYPDSFQLVGSRRSKQVQLGNSVPPPMAFQVARTLLDSLD